MMCDLLKALPFILAFCLLLEFVIRPCLEALWVHFEYRAKRRDREALDALIAEVWKRK